MTIFKLRDCVTTAFEADRKLHQREAVDVTQLPSRAELDHLHRERQFERCRSTSRLIDTAVLVLLICFGLWITHQGVVWAW